MAWELIVVPSKKKASRKQGRVAGRQRRPLRFLFGPTAIEFTEQKLHATHGRGDCLAFNRSGGLDFTISPHEDWSTLTVRFPLDRQPDLVALVPAYVGVPAFFWTAPLPIVNLAYDWNLLWHYFRRLGSMCEHILTDVAGVEALNKEGITHTSPAVLFGCGRDELEDAAADLSQAARDIDILFVGNFNPAVHRERLPWLARLARLAGRRKVVLATNVFGEEYRQLLKRARIVFNRSVRGECNLRTFEAAAARALLFQEEANREVPAFFRDRQECVYYNSENLETLLEHYLDHEDERRAIAEAARAKIPECTFERLWEKQLLELGQKWDEITARVAKRLVSEGHEELLTRTWQALGAGLKDDPALVGDLRAAIAQDPNAASLQNALGVVLGMNRPRGEEAAMATQAATTFRKAWKIEPSRVLFGLNVVEALIEAGQDEGALIEARRVLERFEQHPELAAEDRDVPHFPPEFDAYRVEWERAAWSNAGNLSAELAAKSQLVRWRLHLILGGLSGALEHYEAAHAARPDLPMTKAALGCALARAGRAAEAVQSLREAVADYPFDLSAARSLYHALDEIGDRAACEALAESRRRLAQAAPQLVPVEPWFSSSAPPPAASPSVAAATEGWLRRLSLDDFHRAFRSLDTSRALAGFTNAVDTNVVLTLLRQVAPCKRILEIGTAAGHMTANFTEWSDPDATIYTLGITADMTVPTSDAQRHETPPRDAFGKMSNHFGKAGKVLFITADSLTFDFGRLAPLDFAFIDGAHDLAHVLSDSLKVYQALRPGGCMVWHDFTSPVNWVEVRPALERLRFEEPVVHVAGSAVAFLQKGSTGGKPIRAAAPAMRETSSTSFAVAWEGAQRAVHSFGHINRYICEGLIRAGHEVSLVPSGQPGFAERGVGGSLPPPGFQLVEEASALPDVLEQRLFQRLSRPVDIHVRHQWPPLLTPPRDGRWVVIQPWEFGSPPKEWIAPMNEAMDEVWVPSRFVRDCLVEGGVRGDRIHVVPWGVDTARFHPQATPVALKTRKRFKFLFVGGTIHRKGIDILLRAYAAAFTADDDVCLVVKDMGTGTVYQGQTAASLIAELQGRANAPEVEYLSRDLSETELIGLYTACDCLVHPYRGEGFALPIAEAMGCGLPVIITGHGAALDYCDAASAYLIPAQRTFFADNRVGTIETVDRPWLVEPNLKILVEIMQRVVTNESERRQKAAVGCERIHRHYTWNHTLAVIQHRFHKLMMKPPRRFAAGALASARQTISLCMIVKNEEGNLADCLGPVKDLVAEMIVVDTGSSDRTREVAVNLGARVVDFPWVDSFAAARNETLRHATGNWIFWMDADDRVDRTNRDQLKELFSSLRDENAAYVMKCACVPRERSGTTTVVDHVRLFRNAPEIRWEYRVHEQILLSLRRVGADVRWCNVVVQHVGYQDNAVRHRKLERDLRLLKLEDADRPDDPFTLFNLGSVYQELGLIAEAVPVLRRSLERSHPHDSIVRKLYALLSQSHRVLGERELAVAAASKGREFYPEDVELLFQEGLARRDLGDAAGAEACWRKLLEPKSHEHFASVDAGIAGYKTRHNLAMLYQETGRFAEAEQEWQRALAEQPAFLPALVGLAELFLRAARWSELDQCLNQLDTLGLQQESLVLRARSFLSRQEWSFGREVCGKAISLNPRNAQAQRVLSYILLQEGTDWDAAEDALKAILELEPNDAEAQGNLALLQRKREAGDLVPMS